MNPSFQYDKNALFCYETYKSIKLHFTSGYDYFKYHGKSLSSSEVSGFELSRYFPWCNKISKGKTKSEIVEFILANTILSDGKWIDSMVEGEKVWVDWKKRQDSIAYVFEGDISTLIKSEVPFCRYFKPFGSEYPSILLSLMRKEISLETVVILDIILGFNDRLIKYYDGDFVVGDVVNSISNYQPFLLKYHRFDDPANLKRFKVMIRKMVEETENILPF